MVLIYLYSVWVEQPSDIIYDKCSLIVLEDRRWKYSPPQTPPPTHLPSEARDVNMCEYFHPWNLTRPVFVRFSFLCWTLLTLFFTCPCFCKRSYLFHYFCRQKKNLNYLILIVFFYLNRTILRFLSPHPAPPLLLPHHHPLSVLI